MAFVIQAINFVYQGAISIILIPLAIFLHLIFLYFILYIILRLFRPSQKKIRELTFLHPSCAAFGGGEKVLWTMIRTLINMDNKRRFPDWKELWKNEYENYYIEDNNNNIYDNNRYYSDNNNLENMMKNVIKEKEQQLIINIVCKDNVDFEDLNEKLKQRFNIDIKHPHDLISNKDFSIPASDNIEEANTLEYDEKKNFISYIRIVPIISSTFLNPSRYFTMLFQILSQMLFAIEVVVKLRSDIIIDTQGLPFAYPILKYLGNSKVSAYTHYPFISNDMIEQVSKRQSGVHSRGIIGFLTKHISLFRHIKLLYYKMILLLYKLMGYCIEYDACNSSWTKEHMENVWTNLKNKKKIGLIFPPCNLSLYSKSYLAPHRRNIVLSLGQFRPEKRQLTQLKIFSRAARSTWELHIIGGVRNEEDEAVYQELIFEAQRLGLEDRVKIMKNMSINDIIEEFKSAKIGLHTMEYEHFGITIVEMMAAGLIVITHNSAGAQKDIIISNETKTGFLVNNIDEYIDKMREIMENLELDEHYYDEYSQLAHKKAEQFSEQNFMKIFYLNLPYILGEK